MDFEAEGHKGMKGRWREVVGRVEEEVYGGGGPRACTYKLLLYIY